MYIASPITTFTLFGLSKGNTRWGLAQMGIHAPVLQKVPGLSFFKMLGCGKGRVFSLWPDFGRYGLICSWQSEAAADAFLQNSDFMRGWQERCHETWTVKLLPYRSHGLWDGQNPFQPAPEAATHAAGQPVVVLTRASVRLQAVFNFSRHGFHTDTALQDAAGLLASVGMGEKPFVRLATFSIWESEEAMRQYAYKHPRHIEAMKRTRAEKWYSEELFARFVPVAASGTWHGRNPLPALQPVET